MLLHTPRGSLLTSSRLLDTQVVKIAVKLRTDFGQALAVSRAKPESMTSCLGGHGPTVDASSHFASNLRGGFSRTLGIP